MNSAYLKELLLSRHLDLSSALKYLGCYRLDGYVFAYNRKGSLKTPNRTGGNIQPQSGTAVYGVVWKLSQQALEILDREEQVPILYHRHKLNVINHLNPNDVKEVEVYIANPDSISAKCYPRPFYVQLVVEGAREHGLPEEYITKYLIWHGPWGV